MLPVMTKTRDAIIAAIDCFQKEMGLSDLAFSNSAVGSNKFVGRLRRGQSVTLASIEKAENWMAAERAGREGVAA